MAQLGRYVTELGAQLTLAVRTVLQVTDRLLHLSSDGHDATVVGQILVDRAKVLALFEIDLLQSLLEVPDQVVLDRQIGVPGVVVALLPLEERFQLRGLGRQTVLVYKKNAMYF